jgi:hypothetical protein
MSGKFTDNSAKVIARIKSAMNEVVAETAEEIGEIAQSSAPVKTGELRDSKAVQISFMVAWVGFTARHILPVTFGTTTMSGNPFFFYAVMQARSILLNKLQTKRL